ncbi:MAG: CpXC domain-containing protein [Anaerolineae bacterium]|nr:CpXC domain-containing protein [Anaerolineae bacterium]
MDVRKDPSGKSRLLSGLVNVAVCPQCHKQGSLNLPFLYHDPEKELALVYMPMGAATRDLQQQQMIGKLTSEAMDSLPAEERKGYLFQPQIFLTMESLIKPVLEADGVTEEMVEEQKAKAELLQRLIDAPSASVLEARIKENDAVIDSTVLRLLSYNLQIMQSAQQIESVQKLMAVRANLFDHSSEGRKAKARAEVLQVFREEPTREKLVELLVAARDSETREVLIAYGIGLLDYTFFQSLSALVEETTDDDEKDRMTELRKEILSIRDEIQAAVRAEQESRAALLRDLLLSSDPEALARQRFSELDEVFLSVLASSLRDARTANSEDAIKALTRIEQVVMRLIAESIPPEIRLFNHLMETEEPAEVERLVRENRKLVDRRMVAFLEQVTKSIGDDAENADEAKQVNTILEIVRRVLAE